MSAMAGDPDTVLAQANASVRPSENDSVTPTTVDEALDLLRTIHKKVGRLEKRLEGDLGRRRNVRHCRSKLARIELGTRGTA